MSATWPPTGTLPLPIKVVSVQSQVIYGRVGNNVAIPTFLGSGLSVAAVPTVLLSNTPHYDSIHGGPIPLDWFSGHLDDLVARGALNELRAVQCGYLGSAGQARVLADWIERRRAERSGLRVLIDPVIGDHDHGIYVDPALVTAYRERLLQLADVLTPNDFELSHLAGTGTDTIESSIVAARSLLRGRVRTVIVTSAAPATWPAGEMQILLVGAHEAHLITHPCIDIAPKGTGDLFSASLMAQWLAGDELPLAAARAAARVVHAMRTTRDVHCAELMLPGPAPEATQREVSVHHLSF